ncbi:unnamed protein product [Moneuplotes crassus]|uniref:Uncharacterized protein n=4 Tax=Euplotes crassus TaxID=5936 RepID=A0AAD2D7W8_EUPCR|nr:unnamed protein product [Moneuplotes crassus]
MGISKKKFKVCRKMNPKFLLNSVKPQITPDNEYLIVAKDTKLLIYNINTGFCVAKCVVDFSIKQKTGYVKGFSVYGDGDKIIAGYKKGFIVVWDISKILEPGIENFVSFDHDIDNIVINSESKHAIVVNRAQKIVKSFDILNNFSLASEITNDALANYRGSITCSGDSKYFAFITQRIITVIDLENKDCKQFRANFNLTTIKMQSEGKYLVVGDCVGKIHHYYDFFNEHGPTISSRHWHSNRVNVLEFTKDNAFLLSGGKEAVLVLWHQVTQENSFVSRIGNQIVNLSTSDDGTLFAVSMSDNSIKIIRAQNYEIVHHFRGLIVEPGNTKFIQNNTKNSSNKDLIFYGNTACPSTLQVYDSVLKRVSGVHSSLNRNYVSNSFGGNNSQYQIKDCIFSSTGEEMITYEQLNQCSSPNDEAQLNTDINLKTLKFWKVYSDGTFGLEAEVPDPHFSSGNENWMLKANTSASTQNKVYTASGNELKIWQKKKGQSFELLCTLKYKDILDETFIPQLQDNNSGSESEATEDSKHLETLTKVINKGDIRGFQPDFIYKEKDSGLCVVYDDYITIWDEKTYALISQYKLKKPTDYVIHKVVFDGKGRRLALHTSIGLKVIDVELQQEIWKLDFTSIKMIESSQAINSQFFITMNSEDVDGGITDALLIFSFRTDKPLKIIKFPAIDSISYGKYVNLNNLDSPSICILTSKGFIQYINCMKRGENESQTRIELIKRESSFHSPDITPMINFGDLDEELEDFKLDERTKISTAKTKNNYDAMSKASDMYFSKAKIFTNNVSESLNEYFSTILKPRTKEDASEDYDLEMTDIAKDHIDTSAKDSLEFRTDHLESQFDEVLKRVFK